MWSFEKIWKLYLISNKNDKGKIKMMPKAAKQALLRNENFLLMQDISYTETEWDF